MQSPKSAVVCGGGIVGLCCAWHLARDGFKVTLVERNAEGQDSCASGSAGFISPSHFVPLAAPGAVAMGLRWMFDSSGPFYVQPRLNGEFLRWSWLFYRAANRRRVERAAPLMRDLSLASRAWFDEFAAATGNPFSLEKRGLFTLCRTEKTFEHEAQVAALAHRLGVEAEVLDARQTALREPGMRMEIAGSVFFPVDCHVTPRRLLTALKAELARLGVEFRWNTTVAGWRIQGDRIAAAQTAGGEIAGDEFILAGGSWSPGMAAGLGIRMPMQAGKGYSLTLEHPRQSPTAALLCVESRIGVTPMSGALRFAGTMELSGMNDRIRPERVRQIVRAAPLYFPELKEDDFSGATPWVGRRPVSPDGLPYVGRFGRHRNLIAACGHAMLGVSLAPATGKLVSDIATGRQPSFPTELLDPDRYA